MGSATRDRLSNMIEYEEISTVRKELKSVTCDVCKKKYTDTMDIQEFQHIRFYGGYTSVFGDGALVECDICQHCLKKKLGKHCRK